MKSLAVHLSKTFNVINNGTMRYFLSSTPPNYLRLNLAKGRLPFPPLSFKYCYTSHFLEHLEVWQMREVLGEVYRLLVYGGVCRIVIPDLEILTLAYFRYKQGNYDAFTNLHLSKDPVIEMNEHFGNIYDINTKIPDLLRPLAYRQLRKYGHKFMIDYDFLKSLLLNAGFDHVSKQKFRCGEVPDLMVLDLDGRQFESMYIEAFKK